MRFRLLPKSTSEKEMDVGASALDARAKKIVLELWSLLFFAACLILLLSLVSYTGSDYQGFLMGGQIDNWIGPGGLLMAESLFGALGVQAYGLSAFFCALGFACLFPHRVKFRLPTTCGVVLLFVSLSIGLHLMTAWFPKNAYPVDGFVGLKIGGFVKELISPIGAGLVAIFFGLAGMILITQWSLETGLKKGPFLFGRIFYLTAAAFNLTISKVKFLKQIQLPQILRPKPIIADEAIVENIEAAAFSFSSPKFAPVEFLKPNILAAAEETTIPTQPSQMKIIEPSVGLGAQGVSRAEKESPKRMRDYILPPLNLLDYDEPVHVPIDPKKLQNQAAKLIQTFTHFGIEGNIREVRPGPVVTMFEFVPAPGVKISRIVSLADDIAMAMEAIHVRVVAPIPGKGAVGIEIPNEERELVYLKEIVADPNYRRQTKKLTMALGKDIAGRAFFVDLAEMPHLLVAGTTGSGKSVSLNAMICSILYQATPDDVRFLMIDPKMLELSIYEGIPHLLLPPIIDSKKAATSLRWAVREMDERYQAMNELGVRDIKGYNRQAELLNGTSKAAKYDHMPYIVIVVDEYADLVAVAGKDVEMLVLRLAQKARACGIHVILATQRPSVDIITGVIKANFPVRMGFRLAGAHDSKTIINRSGAEKLLGKGDMLLIPPGSSDLIRIHGAYISEVELARVVDFWKSQARPNYHMSILESIEETVNEGQGSGDKEERYDEAVEIVARTRKCSTSWIQRQLGVGYNRAARIVEALEQNGVVGPIQNAKGDREILIKNEEANLI